MWVHQQNIPKVVNGFHVEIEALEGEEEDDGEGGDDWHRRHLEPPKQIPKQEISHLDFKLRKERRMNITNMKIIYFWHKSAINIFLLRMLRINILIRIIVFRREQPPRHYQLLVFVLFQICFEPELCCVVFHVDFVGEVA